AEPGGPALEFALVADQPAEHHGDRHAAHDIELGHQSESHGASLACRLSSAGDEAHPREVALADLQHALEARREYPPGVLDHRAVHLHRAFLQLAVGL